MNCDVFELSSISTSDLLCPGDIELVYTITVDFIGAYDSPVTLSAINLPAGVTASFVPDILASPGTSILTITDTGLANGEFSFTVLGTGGGLEDEITLEIIKFDDLPEQVILSSPADEATGVAFNGSVEWVLDPLASSYILEIAEDAAFANVLVTETVEGNSFDFTDLLPPGEVYYWRVTSQNLCGSGPESDVSSFEVQDVVLACLDRSANNTPIDIEDFVTIQSAINIPLGGFVTDVNVSLIDISHTFIGDLDITLTSPEGTVVTLFGRSCGGANDILAGYDDDGIATLPCPPIDGQSYVPANPLAAFEGEFAPGLWTLSVTDNAGADQGTLNDWSLEVCTLTPVIDCTDITDLDITIPDGEYNYPDTIASSGLVPERGNVIFRAPNGIYLDPGFQVDRIALFEAYLEACEE